MGDLPQYFKFVRWMLTSSLKHRNDEIIFLLWTVKKNIKYEHLASRFVVNLYLTVTPPFFMGDR